MHYQRTNQTTAIQDKNQDSGDDPNCHSAQPSDHSAELKWSPWTLKIHQGFHRNLLRTNQFSADIIPWSNNTHSQIKNNHFPSSKSTSERSQTRIKFKIFDLNLWIESFQPIENVKQRRHLFTKMKAHLNKTDYRKYYHANQSIHASHFNQKTQTGVIHKGNGQSLFAVNADKLSQKCYQFSRN